MISNSELHIKLATHVYTNLWITFHNLYVILKNNIQFLSQLFPEVRC